LKHHLCRFTFGWFSNSEIIFPGGTVALSELVRRFPGMLIANARKALSPEYRDLWDKNFCTFFRAEKVDKRRKIFTHIDDFHLTNYKLMILYFQKFRFLTSKNGFCIKFLLGHFFMYKLF